MDQAGKARRRGPSIGARHWLLRHARHLRHSRQPAATPSSVPALSALSTSPDSAPPSLFGPRLVQLSTSNIGRSLLSTFPPYSAIVPASLSARASGFSALPVSPLHPVGRFKLEFTLVLKRSANWPSSKQTKPLLPGTPLICSPSSASPLCPFPTHPSPYPISLFEHTSLSPPSSSARSRLQHSRLLIALSQLSLNDNTSCRSGQEHRRVTMRSGTRTVTS